MTHEERERRDKADLHKLLKQPEFARFLWRVIQTARIFDRATDGSNDAAVAALARRNLGLEILEMVEQGQPVQHPEGQPLLTLLQAIREEAIQQPGETHDKRNRTQKYDRTTELHDDPSDAA